MNNEFEWRSQMKKLGESVEPANDLWPVSYTHLTLPTTERV